MDNRIQIKSEKVSQLNSQIEEFRTFLVFEYLGLEAVEINELRKKLRASDAKLVILKNNILNRALKNFDGRFDFELTGPNAILFTKNDIKPFQEVIKLSKEKNFLKLKLAFFENELIKDSNLEMLASLGSKEELIAKFARTLMTPIYKLLFLIKNIEK